MSSCSIMNSNTQSIVNRRLSGLVWVVGTVWCLVPMKRDHAECVWVGGGLFLYEQPFKNSPYQETDLSQWGSFLRWICVNNRISVYFCELSRYSWWGWEFSDATPFPGCSGVEHTLFGQPFPLVTDLTDLLGLKGGAVSVLFYLYCSSCDGDWRNIKKWTRQNKACTGPPSAFRLRQTQPLMEAPANKGERRV